MANEINDNLITYTYKNWKYTILESFENDLKKYIDECEKKHTVLCNGSTSNAPRFLCAVMRLSIPDNITAMEQYSLANLINLKYLRICGVEEIPEYACANNPKLEIVILDKAKTLKSHSFEHSGSLDNTDMELCFNAEQVENIEGLAFNATGIKNLNLPSPILNLNMDSIAYCPRLQVINFPNVVELDNYVITNNKNLLTFYAPRLKLFEETIFEDCDRLKKVVVSEHAKYRWDKSLHNSNIEVTRNPVFENVKPKK